ncbi:MAG: phosphoribosylaminoimidazolesuccinocarboxamide synthase [Omnitrophica bacterium RBG_13_46_9]|nr:MAG: phosphoribosylaminoimidazolesuccinocarboxamide synthase [Omnitrophica bacterium RBG_13_46_9]
MQKGKQIYEGKAKKVYQTDSADILIQEFKDDATAFDATKRGTIRGKGVINNTISKILFELLESKGIETHFIKQLDERQMLIKSVEIIPLEVTMRNIVAGGMSKLLGIDEGLVLKEPVLEYHYKNDALHDPLINEYHAKALGLATDEELDFIERRSFEINNILKAFFEHKNLILVDFKLEFGRHKGRVLLADEISPDTCRFWDKETREKLDKDRFRRDMGNVEEAYQEVLKRLTR